MPHVVKISGKPYKTVIDEKGVQRFPENRIVSALLDAASSGRKMDMNDIARMTAMGEFTVKERRELYRLIGYSVCGYSEIFPGDTIVNPLWK